MVLLVAGLLVAPRATLAQSPTGAERYEVTITPPKRPGSVAEEAPVAVAPAGIESGAAPAADPGSPLSDAEPENGAGAAASAPLATTAGAAAHDPAPAPEAAAGTAAASGAGGAAVAALAPPSPPSAAPSGPLRTLQVGAFRQHGSAESLHEKLHGSFADVSVIEVQSGGEPLYRVNVGRLPRGPALDDLRKRLIAAGYAAFEVAAPTVSVSD